MPAVCPQQFENAYDSLAEFIDVKIAAPTNRLQDSILGHDAALSELFDVWHDCREPNWDGYDAFAVPQVNMLAAYGLVRSLPFGFPRPSIGAEPDGMMTLEWYHSPHRLLSVSVDPTGYLHYAGLYGVGRRHGRMAYFTKAPNELLKLIMEL